jgi:hypothetical protein
MKYFLTICAIICINISKAQNLNVTYTNCDGNTESLFDILGSGQVVLVASKGLDCSTCISQAPANQTFAANNVGRVRVWGAMSNRYNQANPTCMQLASWKTTHSWNNIFMFVDADRNFEGEGYPTYYVISPVDSLVYFEGNSFTTASQKATQLADSLGLTTSVNNYSKNSNELNIISHKEALIITGSYVEKMPVVIVDIAGRIVYKNTLQFVTNEPQIIATKNLNKGVYLITVGNTTKRFALQ